MGVLRLLFDFRGRVGRARYWMGLAIVHVAAPLILGAIALNAIGSLMADGEDFNKGHAIVGFIGGVIVLFIVSTIAGICTMSLVAKRLHDINVTGLWCLAIFFAPTPLATLATYGALQLGGQAPLFSPGYLTLTLGAAVVLGVVALGGLPGKPGPNQYDHPPLAHPPHPRQETASSATMRQAPAGAGRTGFGLRSQG